MCVCVCECVECVCICECVICVIYVYLWHVWCVSVIDMVSVMGGVCGIYLVYGHLCLWCVVGRGTCMLYTVCVNVGKAGGTCL